MKERKKMLNKVIILSITIILNSNMTLPELIGTPDNGRRIKQENNEAWFFRPESEKNNDAIAEKLSFSRPTDADKFLTGTGKTYGIWFKSKNWILMDRKLNSAADMSFRARNSDAFAMIIAGKVNIPLQSLKGIVLENARSTAQNSKFIKDEKRIVNGNKIIAVQIKGTMKGIRFVFFNYLYSDRNGAIQIVTFTTDNLFEEYQNILEEFLNGFVVLE